MLKVFELIKNKVSRVTNLFNSLIQLGYFLCFSEDPDDALRKRNIIKAPNFTSNSSSQEDIDSLLKYHQNMQEKVAENMVMLTRSLKEQSQIASTIIKADTEVILSYYHDIIITYTYFLCFSCAY